MHLVLGNTTSGSNVFSRAAREQEYCSYLLVSRPVSVLGTSSFPCSKDTVRENFRVCRTMTFTVHRVMEPDDVLRNGEVCGQIVVQAESRSFGCGSRVETDRPDPYSVGKYPKH
jgi:hypothetical protein